MASREPIIIIGGGLNGLVTACYLAKAGLKPLVLEQRPTVGGAYATEEFHPGFRSSLANTAGSIPAQLLRDLRLEQHGVEFIRSPVRVTSLQTDGPAISVYEDAKRTAAELSAISTKDAERYPDFVATFARIGKAIAPVLTMTPIDIDKPATNELWHLGRMGLAIRGLGKKDEYRLLRYGPMAVADLAAEWFETELLRAVVAARGVFGAFAGPWSAGTSAAVLLQAAADGHAIAPSIFAKGSLAIALTKAATVNGAEIRTGAHVQSIKIKDGAASGVVLAGGEEIAARAVISNADPKSTFLRLVDAAELDPSFLTKVRNYRTHGTVAKVSLALSGLPEFPGLEHERLSGRIHFGPDIDYLERAFDAAKYGDFSPQPYLDITIPTLNDASLAPAGGHVMSVHAQFAPYHLKNGGWSSRRDELGDVVVKTLAEYAPKLNELILARRVITPLDLEQNYGLAGGQIHHGEMSLDQLFTFRPLIGWSRYRTPVNGLYLCGAGTHPGGGIPGASGFNASREIIKDLKKAK
jgi:phytoene dehydrogenase-like protein